MFSQSKSESDKKNLGRNGAEPAFDVGASRQSSSPEAVSTLGRGMLITGNVTCVGAVQVLGRVTGDIHATTLTVGEGAHVDGNVIAQEMIVHGSFKGTIHANTVKLQNRATVEGEIFNKSLTIEQNAQFEGVARRLEKAVEPPTSEQARGEVPAIAEVVSISGAAE
jgi:cytoskeletal protein CcmA (bactofilin family)